MGYLSKLRESVGHDTIIMVGATAFVENSRGEILMQLRSDTKDWGLPGGSLEIGEKVEEAAKRELWEETGLKAEDAELMGVYSGPEYSYTYPNGDNVDTVIILYRMSGISGDLHIADGESESLGYFSPDDLPSPLERRTQYLFRELRKQGYWK